MFVIIFSIGIALVITCHEMAFLSFWDKATLEEQLEYIESVYCIND